MLHEPAWNGATVAVARLADPLRRHGWEPTFWVPSSGEALAQLAGHHVMEAGERPFRFSIRELRQPPGVAARVRSASPYLRAFGSAVRQLRPDLVHANTMLTLPEAAVARTLGVATLVHCHEQFDRSLKNRLALRGATLLARRVVAVSPSAAAAFPRGSDVAVVPNGVPLPPRKRRRAPSERPVILTAGTICRRKGSDLFVAVARAVRAVAPAAEFWHAGEPAGGAESSWAADVIREGERSGVRYLGRREDLDRLYEQADVLLFPSRTDPFPLAPLEAMAAGLPVVATRVGGIPGQLGRDAGLLAEPEDVEGLTRLTLRLVLDEAQRARIGDRAQKRAEREFSLERQASLLASHYEAAAGSRRSHPR